MAKTRTAKGPPLEQALERAERFFGKGNFPLAKREFEAALRLGASEARAREIRGKLEVCARELAVLEGREAIKRARKLEKKGRYREALAQFEKAFAAEAQTWIQERIEALRIQLSRAEASELLETVAEDQDPQVRLAAYDRALATGPDPAIATKKADCLVELDRFEEAAALYGQAPPSSDLSRYRQGYAYAALGRHLDALAAWQAMEKRPDGLAEQVEQLLPHACRAAEDEHRADAYEIIAGIAQSIDPSEKSPGFQAWEEYAACNRLKSLWDRQRYEEMLPLLPALDRGPDRPLDRAALALHAKVGLKLAEQDPEHLESAIAHWLTAVYDDGLLASLAVHRVETRSLDRHAIRQHLVERLGAMIKGYATEGRLSPRIEGIWRMEERVVRQLSVLPTEGSPPCQYPCTPGFGMRYGLADGISTFLDRQPHPPPEAGVDLLELRACFAPTGQAMMWMEAGEEERALVAIPRGADGDLVRYCRARIALACGMAKARRGEGQIRRYFLDALPLLEAEPKRVREIADLAYADRPSAFFEGLAEAMEALCGRIRTPEFREATAHAMGIKAVALLNRGTSSAVARKLLERALEIFPDSELAASTLQSLEERRLSKEVAKAFKRQSPLRAAKLVMRSDDPDSRHYFFETMGLWYEHVQALDPATKRGALTEFHESCRLVDEDHPLTRRIAGDLRELETR
jgi:tetratricopeptide (TPR) repeat protein